MKSKLDKWLIYGNCLVGYIYDSKAFPPGTRIKTERIIEVDLAAGDAICSDGRYKLLEPGTEFDHKHEILAKGDVVGGMKVGDFTKSKPTSEKKIIIGV